MIAKHPLPKLVSADLQVPLATGGMARYINLDCAASTPAMVPVVGAVTEALGWYSSVHRGSGYPSQVSTLLYESARQAVATFVGARHTDTVVIVRNTTDAINHLAHCMPIAAGKVVVTSAFEHHANLLPWRRVAPVAHLPIAASPEQLLADLKDLLSAHHDNVAVVAITGASNVTGEVLPIPAIAALVHEAGALLCVDGAQLAPHRAIDMAAMGIDCLALSGHKMYAPFGAGALIAPRALLAEAEPLLAGGGAVDFVTLDDVLWTGLPDRLEAGTPNVIGAVALGAAAAALQGVGMENVATHEHELRTFVDGRLAQMSRVRRLRMWPDAEVDRLGVATFVVDGMHHALLASALSAEYGVGVRHGCFCAHPLISHLLGIDADHAVEIRDTLRRGERSTIPGGVRASFGLGTSLADVTVFLDALEELLKRGPVLTYDQDPTTGDFVPQGDRRSWPLFEHLSIDNALGHGTGCGQL